MDHPALAVEGRVEGSVVVVPPDYHVIVPARTYAVTGHENPAEGIQGDGMAPIVISVAGGVVVDHPALGIEGGVEGSVVVVPPDHRVIVPTRTSAVAGHEYPVEGIHGDGMAPIVITEPRRVVVEDPTRTAE